MVEMPRRPSPQTIAVLELLLADPQRWRHGYDMVKELDVKSGTLYPILMRLEDRGILETRWEESPTEGRPRRHLYRLSEEGTSWSREAVSVSLRPTQRPDLGLV